MIFKRLHKKIDEHVSGDTQPETDIVIESEEQLEERFQKALNEQRRHAKIKKYVVISVIGIGLIGGYRSLVTKETRNDAATAVNDYAFTESYLKNYFTYPQTDDTRAYLQQFTTGTWSPEFDNDVKSVEMRDARVYQVTASQDDKGALTLYVKVELNILHANDKEEQKQIYTAVEVVKQNDKYIVDEPIAMVSTNYIAMSEEERKNAQKDDEQPSGKDLSEDEKKEIGNTIQLFLSTYGSDLEQARLLMESPASLKPLDPDTKISFVSLGLTSQDDEDITATANVLYTTGNYLKQNRNVRFTFDKKTNKIKQMEVY